MKPTIVILILMALSGCRGEPHSFSTFTTKKPLAADLVGTYGPTANTLAFIKGNGQYPEAKMSIVLAKDNTFRMENIPDCWNTPFGKPKGKFDSGVGKWRISQVETPSQNWCRVELNFPSTEGFNSTKDGGQLATSILLVGEGPPYVLHLTVGDPDSDQAMQFEKKAEPKKE